MQLLLETIILYIVVLSTKNNSCPNVRTDDHALLVCRIEYRALASRPCVQVCSTVATVTSVRTRVHNTKKMVHFETMTMNSSL